MHDMSVKRTSHEETMFYVITIFRVTLNSKVNVCGYVVM
jgi:hypothetical protein